MPKIESLVKKYRELRYLVAYLGEKAQFGWWQTSILSKTGQAYHLRLFPRSSSLSTLIAATAVAAKFHDEKLSSSRSFHLFRLPGALEEGMHHGSLDELPALDTLTTESAFARLLQIAEGTPIAADGPVQIGSEKQIFSGYAIPKLAGHYAHALKSGNKSIPYFLDA
jgi:hypothetical protein